MLYIGFPYNLELWKVTVNSSEQHVTYMPCGFDSICDDYFKQNTSKEQIWGDRGKKKENEWKSITPHVGWV